MAGTIQDVTYTKYTCDNGAELFVVAPESDKEELHLPSIALPVKVPCNPRPAYLYLADEKMGEDSEVQKYKEYAFANSAVIVFSEDMESAYAYVTAKTAALNVKKGNVFFAAGTEKMDEAKVLAEKLGTQAEEITL